MGWRSAITRRHALRHGTAAVLIGVGGFVGANLRYAVELGVGRSLAATLAVNVVGSFLLGLILFDARAGDVLSKQFRYVFGTGFCASFTTYSTFVLDAAASSPGVAVAYVIGSYAGGFLAVLGSRSVVSGLASGRLRAPTPGDD